MALHSRPRRLAEEIRTALAEIVRDELKDPRLAVGLITVTHVEVPKDLLNATVHVSVLASDEEAKGVIDALQHSRGYIKRLLGERIHVKYMPDVHFRLDLAGRHAARINEVLKQIERTQPVRDES